jgi:lipopolysaccharide transport system ATP-binding protein
MSSEMAISVEGLSKHYHLYEKPFQRLLQMFTGRRKQYFNTRRVLNDISFQIKKGETVGIIGRNGSGKSTLLQLICGLLNPSGGSIKTHGRIAALLELGAGFNPEFTGRENIYLNGIMLGLSIEEIDEKYTATEAFAEIGDYIEQPVKTYSSGMYVRLALAIQANIDRCLGDQRCQVIGARLYDTHRNPKEICTPIHFDTTFSIDRVP